MGGGEGEGAVEEGVGEVEKIGDERWASNSAASSESAERGGVGSVSGSTSRMALVGRRRGLTRLNTGSVLPPAGGLAGLRRCASLRGGVPAPVAGWGVIILRVASGDDLATSYEP
jgi:hypothetical protein